MAHRERLAGQRVSTDQPLARLPTSYSGTVRINRANNILADVDCITKLSTFQVLFC